MLLLCCEVEALFGGAFFFDGAAFFGGAFVLLPFVVGLFFYHWY
jgi:hypothetical protein